MIDLNEIQESVKSEITRLDEPRNRARYFMYGKAGESDSDGSYSVVFRNAPERVLRDIKYVYEPLFRVGDLFVNGKFEKVSNGVKVTFEKAVLRSSGIDNFNLRQITDFGIDYIMDGRRLTADLLNFLTINSTNPNEIVSSLLDKSVLSDHKEVVAAFAADKLNESQIKAVKKALSQNITFVWGPPGTGKTKTMGALASHLIKNGKRVLLTALSNKALDQLLISTLESASPLNKFNITVARTGSVDNMHDSVKIFSRDIYQNRQYRIKRNAFTWNEHVSLCTCVATNFASLASPKTADPGPVDFVIADEMSMASIPAIIAACYYAKKGVVLGGDPMQLPPIFPDDADKPNAWFSRNIFDMAKVERHDERTAFLDTQYRMQEPIGNLVSDLFYEGELKTGTAKKDIKGTFKSNIVFINCKGKIENINGAVINGTEERRFNEKHAEAIAGITIKLVNNKEFKSEEIGIIAPYNAQIVKIKEVLAKSTELIKINPEYFEQVQVSTIHSFQGQEKSVIIMNICDDEVKPTRLTARKELINVALSRAKELLIIVGNRDYLLNQNYFSKDETEIFKKIIESSEVINSEKL
ncbi:MAG: ATP-dependent RecD-like DNA helicase [bacterium ADurb.Bin243]|nr:MAG: ATP-dependent RecD-like DNA helicase [bacterium ADurb.Bin243]